MPPQNLGCAKIYVIRSFKRKEKGGCLMQQKVERQQKESGREILRMISWKDDL